MLNHFLHCAKPELAEQPFQPWHRASEAKVVRERDPFGKRDPGMIGIKLPRVNVKICRQTFLVQDPNVTTRNCVRVDPKIGPPGTGPYAAEGFHCGNGKLT